MIEERSFEDRSRVSAPCVRTFLNITDRWDLSLADRLALLDCDERQFEEWSAMACSHGPLVLEIPVLLRISAILGVFMELRQRFASADQERGWLVRTRTVAPFEGRAPLELLRGSLDDQLAVRLYAMDIWQGGVLPNEIDRDLSPSTEPRITWDDARPQLRAVCFDGFGTLVEIGDKRRPFKALLGDNPNPDLVARALTTPTSLRELAREVSFAPDEESMAVLEAGLAAELASTRLRQGTEPLWAGLRGIGMRVGVCSNLASPYEHALLGCLPRVPDALVLSFKVGLRKPQAEIYRRACTELRVQPEHVLFVGDRLEEDVLGPQRAGLFAMHIGEFETALARGPAPATPSPIVEFLERLAEVSREPHLLPRSPEEALDFALSYVRSNTRTRYNRNQLLHVLRSPTAVMQSDDLVLQDLLSLFITETDEALLIRIASGTEISWAELTKAGQAALPPGHPKLAWIVAREIMSAAAHS